MLVVYSLSSPANPSHRTPREGVKPVMTDWPSSKAEFGIFWDELGCMRIEAADGVIGLVAL